MTQVDILKIMGEVHAELQNIAIKQLQEKKNLVKMKADAAMADDAVAQSKEELQKILGADIISMEDYSACRHQIAAGKAERDGHKVAVAKQESIITVMERKEKELVKRYDELSMQLNKARAAVLLYKKD